MDEQIKSLEKGQEDLYEVTQFILKAIKTTDENLQQTELFAYCDTHFILKNSNNKYFLVNMEQKIITNIPAQLLLSKEMNSIINGKVLKVCQSTDYIEINGYNND